MAAAVFSRIYMRLGCALGGLSERSAGILAAGRRIVKEPKHRSKLPGWLALLLQCDELEALARAGGAAADAEAQQRLAVGDDERGQQLELMHAQPLGQEE